MIDVPEGGAVVNKEIDPPHYRRFPVEVIEITEHLNFNRGNAVKYLARAGHKEGADELTDLEKAKWYVEREINRVRLERSRDRDKGS